MKKESKIARLLTMAVVAPFYVALALLVIALLAKPFAIVYIAYRMM